MAKKPEVGDGATLVYVSDREPATVIKVSKSGHKIVVQEDASTRTDNNGMSECQVYKFKRNRSGLTREATRRKDGSYRVKGTQMRVLIGLRSKYYDYSF